jgi:hypothetical protein
LTDILIARFIKEPKLMVNVTIKTNIMAMVAVMMTMMIMVVVVN